MHALTQGGSKTSSTLVVCKVSSFRFEWMSLPVPKRWQFKSLAGLYGMKAVGMTTCLLTAAFMLTGWTSQLLSVSSSLCLISHSTDQFTFLLSAEVLKIEFFKMLHFQLFLFLTKIGNKKTVGKQTQLLPEKKMPCRSNRQPIGWMPESSYIVPHAANDALPHASEGSRSLSDVQESAQILSGEDFPTVLLEALLSKIKPQEAMVVNTTPYDGWLETVCLKWDEQHDYKIAYQSTSLNPTVIDFTEKKIALQLLEAHQNGTKLFALLGRNSFAPAIFKGGPRLSSD